MLAGLIVVVSESAVRVCCRRLLPAIEINNQTHKHPLYASWFDCCGARVCRTLFAVGDPNPQASSLW